MATAVSGVIRVVANNDAPKGSASFALVCTMHGKSAHRALWNLGGRHLVVQFRSRQSIVTVAYVQDCLNRHRMSLSKRKVFSSAGPEASPVSKQPAASRPALQAIGPNTVTSGNRSGSASELKAPPGECKVRTEPCVSCSQMLHEKQGGKRTS